MDGYFVVGASGMDMAVIDENDIEAGVKLWVDLSKTALSGDTSGINRLFMMPATDCGCSPMGR